MKVDFSNLFNNPKNKSNETELTLIKQLIVSKELIFENFNIAIFLSVYCLRCIELLPELKKEEESLSKNGCVLIFDSSNEEMQNIITHFNLKIPTINTDLDFFVNDLKINKTPNLMAWNNEGTIVETKFINNITDIKSLFDLKNV
ncbi:hypothetical protein MKZ23_31085 [Paenibacillus sp. FSL R5-0876]|uniref:Thioredoxin domain-containing protein n=2 Tax=Paenibacillus TaxID=44249 RepID=A0A1R0X1F6_9BACL|nr:hypothetical protein [Paenibacillus odorifer]OMD26725.1 hypothetical protein BJP51_26395 [Paenibacillus odorifer]OME30566.1 hypothetical protein BSK63_16865 [Paenibacillus odorifer]OME32623.1 hypothetical protein BSK58_27950 [Paenibacillus odorifer]